MNRVFLTRLPRFAATARKTGPSAIYRPLVSIRLLSTSTPPPSTTQPSSNLPPVSSNSNTTSSAQPSTSQEPQVLTAAPDAVSNVAEGAAGAADAATDVAVQTTLSLSDTLLQPAMALLNGVHDVTGLPWWLSIAASTLAIRAAILPVTLMTMRNSARMSALKEDIAAKRESVMSAVRSGDRPRALKEQTAMTEFMKKAGVTPFNVLLGPLVQFPVFISLFVGLRRMSQADPSFATGGAAWFMDLSTSDPTFVLPVVCGGTLLAMTELGGDTGNTNITKEMRMGLRAIAVLSVPLTYWFPAAVFCYWIPNNMFSTALGAAIKTDAARKLLGLQVDLKGIPGTRASREHTAKLAALGKTSSPVMAMDSTARIASYGRSGVATDAAAHAVKPVLLKQKPTKKKARSSGN